jgi:hypothetical protein
MFRDSDKNLLKLIRGVPEDTEGAIMPRRAPTTKPNIKNTTTAKMAIASPSARLPHVNKPSQARQPQ